VSSLSGQPVLVTEFVPGQRPRGNGRTYGILGALLGRLHARAGEACRRPVAGITWPWRERRPMR
jgi:hypothetical protein